MTFKSKVEKIVMEMGEGKIEDITKKIKDRALNEILKEVPEQIEKLFIERMHEVDKMIHNQVKEHIKNEMAKSNT